MKIMLGFLEHKHYQIQVQRQVVEIIAIVRHGLVLRVLVNMKIGLKLTGTNRVVTVLKLFILNQVMELDQAVEEVINVNLLMKVVQDVLVLVIVSVVKATVVIMNTIPLDLIYNKLDTVHKNLLAQTERVTFQELHGIPVFQNLLPLNRI